MRIVRLSALVAIACAGIVATGCDLERRDRANQAPMGSGAGREAPHVPGNNPPAQQPGGTTR